MAASCFEAGRPRATDSCNTALRYDRHRRSIQRPAQPRQCVQADTRFEGSPWQPLQRGVIEQAVAARGVRDRRSNPRSR
jgi:hypothetical protein